MDMNFGGIATNDTQNNNALPTSVDGRNNSDKAPVVAGPPVESCKPVQRRRRWTAEEKKCIIDEIERQGMSTSAVARKYGISLRLLFSWRRQMRQQLLSSLPECNSDVSGLPETEQLRARVSELERLLGKKMVENQLLKEALGMAVVSPSTPEQPVTSGS